MQNLLWYRQPAAEWNEALPIGNGRMGAMIFGGVAAEHLQFNESTVWTGRPHCYDHEGAVNALPRMRELLNEARRLERNGDAEAARVKQKEAEDIGTRDFMSVPLRQKAYQPCGDLRLIFHGARDAEEYRRELDLDSGVVRISYRIGETSFVRECFASYPDDVIVLRISSDRPGRISFTARMDSPHGSATVANIPRTALKNGNQLALFGGVDLGGVRFEARLAANVDGGSSAVMDDAVMVENADSVTLLLAAATSVRNYSDNSADPSARCEAILAKTAGKGYDELLPAHADDYRTLFRRVSLELGRTEEAGLPTDERLCKFATGDELDDDGFCRDWRQQ